MKNKELTKEELQKLSTDELVETILKQREEISEISQKVDDLMDLLRASNTRQYGRKTEDALEGQLSFAFNEAEYTLEKTPQEETEEVKTYTRKKPQGKRALDLSKLPKEIIHHRIPEEQLSEMFGEDYDEFEPDIYSKVEYQPAVFKVLEHHVHIYHGTKDNRIIRAEHPVELLDNSIATPSLAAGIMNAKYVNSVPLYRLEQEFKRREFNLSRQVMSGWMIKLAERYLSLLYDRLKSSLLSHHVIHADETPVLVNKDGRKAGSKSYMWVYRSNVNDDHPVLLYDYRKTRNTENLKDFIQGFQGVIVSDGYVSYHKLQAEWPEDITVAGCWVHARRKFADIVKSASGSDKKKPKFTLAQYAISQIGNIYNLDNKLWELSREERTKERNLTVRKAVEAFFEWAEAHLSEVTKGSNIGKALHYAINQKQYLMAFLDDPDIPLDNNAAERAIRPFCVGKHNWHMIDTVNGAASSAIIYSLAETAKANNISPFEYFRYVLEVIPQHMGDTGMDFLEGLLPWAEQVTEHCGPPSPPPREGKKSE